MIIIIITIKKTKQLTFGCPEDFSNSKPYRAEGVLNRATHGISKTKKGNKLLLVQNISKKPYHGVGVLPIIFLKLKDAENI